MQKQFTPGGRVPVGSGSKGALPTVGVGKNSGSPVKKAGATQPGKSGKKSSGKK